MSSLEQVACDDLKAFERRLTEIIASSHPTAIRWRIVLVAVSIFVAIGAFYWLSDPLTAQVSFLNSMWLHPFFSTTSITMIILFLTGIHRRVVAPSILVQRTREVLFDFSMDCDDHGRLILKPRPATA
ncbi:nuclear envelope phosphatase-regulatory subunit 1-like [Eurytemora carolleeae]|uniref:nuclear envelope phosphatase-regulatory subunit 1-like n=1 Tax=Eurytemora carolleeae TaxID=1294199 RepID=UPI000C785C0B|nr:nuclear envelope phosphatase-regulatory subunit 1-like [Eurytemora carolleeae]XP_023337760.1 nuclear envelope phosphatase-regulatory subunit 1-like [Eurytemora carolleeae]|eukprot:XP_023337759.1 nuclear envelope phosphatase-regulatory subunit 1-like [Eurytemora affinis]